MNDEIERNLQHSVTRQPFGATSLQYAAWRSLYRQADAVRRVFRRLPKRTLDPLPPDQRIFGRMAWLCTRTCSDGFAGLVAGFSFWELVSVLTGL